MNILVVFLKILYMEVFDITNPWFNKQISPVEVPLYCTNAQGTWILYLLIKQWNVFTRSCVFMSRFGRDLNLIRDGFKWDAQVSSQVSNIVMLTINSRSPWEMISGFNLTATRSEKRQGMKLCSSLRTICDSTWPDQFHGWKCVRKLDPTGGSLCLQFLRHAMWMNILFVVISMLFSGESNYIFSSVAFQIQNNW